MSGKKHPFAIPALEAPARVKPSNYPEPFASCLAGREKRPLGDLFGLVNFGVNLTRLRPGAISALRHAHSKQDEFVFVLQGRYPDDDLSALLVSGQWRFAHKDGTPY